jgi:hypothetical protein
VAHLVAQDQVGLEREQNFEVHGRLFADDYNIGHVGGDVIPPGIAGEGFDRADRLDADGEEGFGAFIGQHDDALRVVRHVRHAHGVGDFTGKDRGAEQGSAGEGSNKGAEQGRSSF